MSEVEAAAVEAPVVEAVAEPTPVSDWREALPSELKEAPYLKGDKTPEQIVADLENAASWQGNSIRIPGPDATPEAKAEFMAKAVEKIPGLMPKPDGDNYNDVLSQLGKPAEAEGYKYAEGVDLGDLGDTLKTQAFEAGLTQAQFSTLVAQQMSASESAQEAAEAAVAATYAELQGEWGQAADDRIRDVEALLSKEDAPAALKAAFEDKDMDAATIKWLYGVAEAAGEKAQLKEQTDGRVGALTPDEAREQAQEIWLRLAEMPMTDPRRAALKAKRTELVSMYAG